MAIVIIYRLFILPQVAIDTLDGTVRCVLLVTSMSYRSFWDHDCTALLHVCLSPSLPPPPICLCLSPPIAQPSFPLPTSSYYYCPPPPPLPPLYTPLCLSVCLSPSLSLSRSYASLNLSALHPVPPLQQGQEGMPAKADPTLLATFLHAQPPVRALCVARPGRPAVCQQVNTEGGLCRNRQTVCTLSQYISRVNRSMIGQRALQWGKHGAPC